MKTNEDLFEEFYKVHGGCCESMYCNCKSSFLIACNIKDKEIERLNKKYQEDTYEIATLFSEKNKELNEQLGKANEVIKDFLVVIEKYEFDVKDRYYYQKQIESKHYDYLKQLEQG